MVRASACETPPPPPQTHLMLKEVASACSGSHAVAFEGELEKSGGSEVEEEKKKIGRK